MPFYAHIDSESDTSMIFTSRVEVSNQRQLNAVDITSQIPLINISKAFGDFNKGDNLYYNSDTENWVSLP